MPQTNHRDAARLPSTPNTVPRDKCGSSRRRRAAQPWAACPGRCSAFVDARGAARRGGSRRGGVTERAQDGRALSDAARCGGGRCVARVWSSMHGEAVLCGDHPLREHAALSTEPLRQDGCCFCCACRRCLCSRELSLTSRFLGWVLGPVFWGAGMYEGARFRRQLFPSGIIKLLSTVDWFVSSCLFSKQLLAA
jgi:hypothetical protein